MMMIEAPVECRKMGGMGEFVRLERTESAKSGIRPVGEDADGFTHLLQREDEGSRHKYKETNGKVGLFRQRKYFSMVYLRI